MPNQKVRRKSLDRTNTLDGLTKISTNNTITRNKNVKEQLQSSSTSSTETSSISSAASFNLLADQTNKQTDYQRSTNLLNCMAAAEAAAKAALLNNVQSDKNSNQSTPNSNNSDKRIFNFDLNKTEESMSSLNSSLLFKTTTDISSPDTVLNEQKFKNKLNQFKNSNYCSTNEFNLYTLELNVDDKLPPAEERVENDDNKAVRKQPPPIMKKPEKSQEIMRKLGRSPDQQQQNKSLSSSSSTISSLPSMETQNHSPANSDTSKLSIRLSNSKATDV